ncbi:hypothetical protein GY45DRAFT_905897 [Cubamyces sp. BRFM 1775]|nr:hypothetical protein GY45DRAFT_905897 [Cubamyces sp. BRFM 1775]
MITRLVHSASACKICHTIRQPSSNRPSPLPLSVPGTHRHRRDLLAFLRSTNPDQCVCEHENENENERDTWRCRDRNEGLWGKGGTSGESAVFYAAAAESWSRGWGDQDVAIDSKRPTTDRDGARGAEHRGRNRFREVTSSTLGLAVGFSEAA